MDNITITTNLSVEGMHCASCVSSVEKQLASVEGVKSVSVNLLTSTALVKHAPSTNSKALVKAIKQSGYKGKVLSGNDWFFDSTNTVKPKSGGLLIRTIFALLLGGIVVAICMVPSVYKLVQSFVLDLDILFIPNVIPVTTTGSMFVINFFLMLLTIPVQFVCGWPFFRGAFASIKTKRLNMDVLVLVGTLAAFVMSVYITFEPFIINNWRLNLSSYVNSCMAFFDACCMIIAFVLIGRLVESRAKCSASKAVRELIKLVPETASKIVNCTTAAKLYEKLKLSQPLDLKQVKLLDIEQCDMLVVEPNGKIPTDGVVIAGKSMVDFSMLTGESELIAVQAGDCVSGGTVNGSGRLIIQVEKTIANSTIAQIANSVIVAQGSKAPIQRLADKIASIFVPVVLFLAVLTFLFWLFILQGTSYEDISIAVIRAVSVCVVACPCALGLATPTAIAVAMGQALKHGIVLKDGNLLEIMCDIKDVIFDKTGTLTVGNYDCLNNAKTVRAEAQSVIARLTNIFAAKTHLVTGDNRNEAIRIADEVGISIKNVLYQASPQDKLDYISRIMNISKDNKKTRFSRVAFVGDGINDAPALAKADVGFTLETSTNIALESGDVILVHNNLADLETSIRLSFKTMRKVKQNMFWAFFYNFIMIPLAAIGFMSPAVCAGAMALSSIIVVLNSLMLKRFK